MKKTTDRETSTFPGGERMPMVTTMQTILHADTRRVSSTFKFLQKFRIAREKTEKASPLAKMATTRIVEATTPTLTVAGRAVRLNSPLVRRKA
jgi:hypothetical protein